MAWSFGRQMILAGMALAICFLTTNADENGWQSIAVEKSFDNSPFTYRMKLSARRSGYKIYKLYYPSPVATPVVQNNTIPAEYYLPNGAEAKSEGDSPIFSAKKSGQSPGVKRPAVICMHILDGNDALTDLVCSTLAARGIPAIKFMLPYYGERSLPEGPVAMAKDPKLFAGAIAQAAQDVRRTIDVLAARPEVDPQKIGITGISLGGIVSATAAGGEPRIHRASLMLAGGDLLKIIAHARETRPLMEMIEAMPTAERQALEKTLKEVDPLRYAETLKKHAAEGRVLMINAAEDEVIPRACTDKLAEAMGMEDQVVWLEGLGHYTAMAELPRALRMTADFFAQDLPPGAVPPPTPAAEKTPVQRLADLLHQFGMFLMDEPRVGRSHFLEVEFTATPPDQSAMTGRLRYVRGANHRFALSATLPRLGEVSIGQGRYPWLASAEKAVFEGTQEPAPKVKDPLVFADPRNVIKKKVLAGLLGSFTLAPDILQRFVAVEDDSAADGPQALCLTSKERNLPGRLRIGFDEDGRTPRRLQFDILGTHGVVDIRGWQLNTVAQEALFQPPAEGKHQAVEQADVYRVFGAMFDFAVESME